jgi:hypothetical protein
MAVFIGVVGVAATGTLVSPPSSPEQRALRKLRERPRLRAPSTIITAS